MSGDATRHPGHVTGDRGEEIAARAVVERGWHIVDRNRRTQRGEADIIAARRQAGAYEGLLVEVKTTRRPHDDPASRVDRDKQARLWRISAELAQTEGFDEVRVAVAVVHLLGADRETVTWLELEPF